MSAAAPAPAAATPPVSDSPWHFLDALGLSDADQKLIQKTRGAELEAILNLACSSRASVLYAYSGNGKSSLINAGLIPKLLERQYVVFKTRPRPPFATASPDKAFIECMLRDVWVPDVSQENQNLPRELLREVGNLHGPAAERLIQMLERLDSQWGRMSNSTWLRTSYIETMRSRTDLPLRRFIAETQRFFGPDTYLLFVCDQFEELFVHYLNQRELQDFVKELAAVVVDPATSAQFLFSMREDWVGSMLVLRKEIPELLLNMYQLLPLRKSAAAPVLEDPLRRTSYRFQDGVVPRILADLSTFYSVLQRRQQYTAVRLTRSPEEDPYLELPALQVIAEKLWETREAVSQPFSMEHYEKLPSLLVRNSGAPAEAPPDPTAQSESPARQVLEGYLSEILAGIAKDEGAAASAADRQDLRIDLLYALTDGTAHRKALSEDKLLAECQLARSGALYPPLTKDEIELALQPLIEARLVRTAYGSNAQREYELAHDFLVRSVAALWKDLDRRRAARMAMERQARGQMEQFRRRERRVHVTLLWLPLLAILAVALSGVVADQQRRANLEALGKVQGALTDELETLPYRQKEDLTDQIRSLDRRDTLLDTLLKSPLQSYLVSRGSLSYLRTLERDDHLADWLFAHITLDQLASALHIDTDTPDRLRKILTLLHEDSYPDTVIEDSVWQDLVSRPTPDDPDLERASIHTLQFYRSVVEARRADYSLYLIPAALAGLLLWVIAALGDNSHGQLTGAIALCGCIVLGLLSATSGLNWDGQWGWRYVLAITLVPLWLATAGGCSIVLWPARTPSYRLRVLSCWAAEFVLVYGLALLPLLANRSNLGAGKHLWVKYIPEEPLGLLAGIAIWVLGQMWTCRASGSTLGGLITGLKMAPRNATESSHVSLGRVAVRELISWAELVAILIPFIYYQLHAYKIETPETPIENLNFLIATFCTAFLVLGTLNWLLKRPLADRIAGLDYSPESVAKPDYSGWQGVWPFPAALKIVLPDNRRTERAG